MTFITLCRQDHHLDSILKSRIDSNDIILRTLKYFQLLGRNNLTILTSRQFFRNPASFILRIGKCSRFSDIYAPKLSRVDQRISPKVSIKYISRNKMKSDADK
ncbi:hypothetical protein LOAG_00188 [Loa loa]|uniref:Uncharacterized protein n=1 Tax=Loa loa TaxID=7209 RepID=A0A1S0UCE1_LOALO|nr:hypothetical protein LOAG_00188 [Loa loa]EFO28295.1 hypothetical protein LOAG_00188 [Loa loa]